jgi:hypothetical protein
MIQSHKNCWLLTTSHRTTMNRFSSNAITTWLSVLKLSPHFLKPGYSEPGKVKSDDEPDLRPSSRRILFLHASIQTVSIGCSTSSAPIARNYISKGKHSLHDNEARDYYSNIQYSSPYWFGHPSSPWTPIKLPRKQYSRSYSVFACPTERGQLWLHC